MNIKRSIFFVIVTPVVCLIGTGAYNRFAAHREDTPLSSTAQAFPVQQPKPLSQAIAQAKAVLVARLVKYTKAPDWKAPNAFIELGTLKPPGEYTFQVLQILKGQCDPNLQLNLPPILDLYYDTDKLPVEEGNQVLLLLKSNDEGHWSPVDPTVPLIRLADNNIPKLAEAETTAGIDSQVISFLLASLVDPTIRSANTYLLRQVVDVRVPQARAPYLDDPNWRTQDHILYCLAINQQVSAIPRIVKLETRLFQARSGTRSVTALDSFKSPAAIPYLNPLLLETAYFVRFNAMSALVNLADRSSIPYLIMALHDPDQQNYIPYNSYATLHRLIPGLGATKDWSLFQIQREAVSRPVYEWWKDELMGKHIQPLPSGEQTPKLEIEVSALPLEKLNSLLFEPSVAMRQKAITALEKRADRGSIPYLILALIDPDASVSYTAYVTLHRLIPALGIAKNREYFEANREAAVRPIYTWWEDELAGNHIPLPKAQPQAANPKSR